MSMILIKNLYKILLVSCIIIIPFYAYEVFARENPRSFGIPAMDGSAIQVYYQEETQLRGVDKMINVRVPQDLDESLLEFDYFYVNIAPPDNNPRHFTISYYEWNTTTNRTGDLLLTYPYSVAKEDNEWRDPRFGEIRIDESNFHVFTQTDDKRFFIIKYLDVEIKFFHRTNPALVREIVTRGGFTATILFYGFQSFIFITVSLYCSSRIKNRLNTWVRFDFATVALIFSWVVIGFLGIAIGEGLTEYDILKEIIQVPASAILFMSSVVFGMWIPSFFTTYPSKLHVIKYSPEIDVTDFIKNFLFSQAVKDPKKLIKVGYEQLQIVKTAHGKKYYRNAQSLIEIIGCLLHGTTAIKSSSKMFILPVNLRTKVEYSKTFYEKAKDTFKECIGELGFYLTESEQPQELLFVTDMKWKKTQVNTNNWLLKILNNFKTASGIAVVIFVGILLFLTWTNQSIDMYGFFIAILGFIYLGYAIYYYTRKYKYLEIDPLSRSALEIIRDSSIASKIERVTTKAITELIDERDGLRVELVKQEFASKGKHLAKWEMSLSGKTKITDLPSIEEFEKREEARKKKSSSAIPESEVDKDVLKETKE